MVVFTCSIIFFFFFARNWTLLVVQDYLEKINGFLFVVYDVEKYREEKNDKNQSDAVE